ncbi:MAG: SMP-30/gluconolactonase/LRE family protein [Geminicoccaceae bacterium]|nr:SMP-30/gluconolactonase/LRE family protein [Geminicoccaceae bacterium]
MSGEFSVSVTDLAFVGDGLKRPECVVATERGLIHVSDARGGVTTIGADGTRSTLRAGGLDDFLPNGFSLLPDGGYAVANLGPEGGAWQLAPDGTLSPLVLEVDRWRLPATNFVHHDRSSGEDRFWISVSTRHIPRELAFDREIADGVIVLKDRKGVRVVKDDLGFANEIKVSPDGKHLYVNETIARRLSRFPIMNDATLGARETVAEFRDGIFPDGFEFDAEDGIWIASVVSNRLVRVLPGGSQQVILDDSDPEAVERAERAWAEGKLGRAEIDGGRERTLGNLASVTFGGPDLKTVYLGSLFATRIATFTSPIAGAEPPHWHY